MSKTVKLGKTGKIILVVVLCLVLLGAVAGVVAWTQSDKYDTKDLSYIGRYEVGGLDSAGNYMSTNASIYTKKPIECQGLNCSLAFDNTISYQLYFYDQNNEFVHTTGRLTGAFAEESVPFFSKYVRIVITPVDDDKVTSLEVGKYAKQLNVSVNREQGFKNYTEDLFKNTWKNGYYLVNGVETVIADDYTGYAKAVSGYVDISSYSEGMIFKLQPGSAYIQHKHFSSYASDKEYIVGSDFEIGDMGEIFTASTGTIYFGLDFSRLPQGTRYIRLTSDWVDGQVSLYCR